MMGYKRVPEPPANTIPFMVYNVLYYYVRIQVQLNNASYCRDIVSQR